MKTCETCKHFDTDDFSRICGILTELTDSECCFEPPEGFGCTLHEPGSFTADESLLAEQENIRKRLDQMAREWLDSVDGEVEVQYGKEWHKVDVGVLKASRTLHTVSKMRVCGV